MKKIISISLIMLFLSGTLYVTDAFGKYQKTVLLVSVFLVLISQRITVNKEKINRTYSIISITHNCFIFIMFTSSIINEDFNSVIGAGGMLVIYMSTYRWYPRYAQMRNDDIYRRSYCLFIIPHLLLLLYSVLKYGLALRRYEGIFANPNSLGGCAVTILSVTLSRILDSILIERKGQSRNKDIYFCLIIIVISLFLIVVSSSRASFVTGCILLLNTFALCLLGLGRTGKITIIKKLITICIIVFIVMVMITQYVDISSLLNESIYDKFMAKSDDLLDGRMDRWEHIIYNASLFGHGLHGYIDAPHNSYLSILAQYGFLAAILFVVFNIMVLIRSIKYAFTRNESENKYLPLLSCLSFISLSLAEGMMLKTAMLLMYFSLPLISKMQFSNENARQMLFFESGGI